MRLPLWDYHTSITNCLGSFFLNQDLGGAKTIRIESCYDHLHKHCEFLANKFASSSRFIIVQKNKSSPWSLTSPSCYHQCISSGFGQPSCFPPKHKINLVEGLLDLAFMLHYMFSILEFDTFLKFECFLTFACYILYDLLKQCRWVQDNGSLILFLSRLIFFSFV